MYGFATLADLMQDVYCGRERCREVLGGHNECYDVLRRLSDLERRSLHLLLVVSPSLASKMIQSKYDSIDVSYVFRDLVHNSSKVIYRAESMIEGNFGATT